MTRFSRSTLLLTLIGSIAPASVAQGPSLFPGPQFAPGTDPNSIAVGDLNGDGTPDLVATRSGSNEIRVLLGLSAGGFELPSDFAAGPMGSNPESIAIGDLDHDGTLDVATANTGSNTVSVLLGTGTGAFGAFTTLNTGSNPKAVSIGDLDGDGNPDLVTANYGSDNVSILRGTGTGSFMSPLNLTVDNGPQCIAIGDFNGDGLLDLATGNSAPGQLTAATASVLLATGQGTYAPVQQYVVGFQTDSRAILTGDVNGDGNLDLLVSVPNIVNVLLGTGSGGFASTTYVSIDNSAIGLGDLNGDGKADLVVARQMTNAVSVLLGLGTGGFGSPKSFGSKNGARSIAITDVNRDGRVDLVVASAGNGSVSELYGIGNGDFTSRSTLAASMSPVSIATGDVNGDGIADLISATHDSQLPFGPHKVLVMLGTAAGSFSAPMAFNVGVYPNSVSVDDLNGDGKLDFAVAINNTGKVSVSIGSGNGTFGAPSSFGAGSIPRSVRIGDLNADGNRDLVTANNGSTTVSVLLGTGSGNFGTHTQFDVGASPTSVAVADLDGNGTPDLLTANNSSQPGTVSVILGTGAGSFGTPSLSSVELEPSMVAVGEFNGDGMADVVAANSWSDTVSVLLGTGNGSLGAQSAIACGLYPSSVAIGDLSGDGIHDLVTTNGSMYSVGPDTVSVLVGSGLGTFGAPIAFGVNGSPVSVAIADVNADGRRDLITANYASNDFSVLLNSMALPGTAGVSVFGTGTSGCEGTIGLNANSIPNLGNVNFAIVGSNAPHDSVGLTLVTDVQDLQGSDLFYVNIVIHVGVAGATEVFTLDVISGPAGEQFAAVPIPNNPGLVGKTYFLQSYWIEPLDNRCTSGAAGLESSRGLSITIQP